MTSDALFCDACGRAIELDKVKRAPFCDSCADKQPAKDEQDRADFARYLTRVTADAQAECSRWARGFVKVVDGDQSGTYASPADAMRWSKDAFRGAARLYVLSYVEALLGKGTDLQTIKVRLTEELIRKAGPNHSTSPVANLVDDEERSAVAMVLEALRDWGL